MLLSPVAQPAAQAPVPFFADLDRAAVLRVMSAAAGWQLSLGDRKYLDIVSDETGQSEVYVMEVKSGRRFPVSTSTRGGQGPRWSRDGGEIYYGSINGPGILVAEVDVESFSVSDPVEISDISRRRFSTSMSLKTDRGSW